jgi:cysteine synthase A
MFRLGLRRFATAAEAARPYGIKVSKAQGTINGFVGGVSAAEPEISKVTS